MAQVIVLGAGPTGLMAARRAAEAGHEVTVLEAADRVGGMAGSFEVAGQRVDFGSHRLHPATPAPLLAELERLLGDDLQVRPRLGRVRLAERWVGFPLRTGDLLRSLPPSFTARLVADAAVTSARGLVSRTEPATFADAVAARFGPTVAQSFYGPYARKLYGIEPHELDAELARRRIAAGSPIDIAKRLVQAGRPEGRTFLYPKRGYGQIADRLAEAAVEAGVDIRLSHLVTRVDVDRDRVRVTAKADPGPYSVEGDVAISTLPVAALAPILTPSPPDAVTSALGRLRTRGMVLVYLALDRPQYTPFDAHYLPGTDLTVARLSEPKNYRDGDDPADGTVLCAEIACWPGDDTWSVDDQTLAGMVADDLSRVGLPAVTPVEVQVRRLGSVYPIYDVAGAHDRAVVDDWIRTGGRLMTTGRQGLRVIDNLHHVLAMGSAAAGSLDGRGEVDQETWVEHLDRFAANVVED